MSFLDYVQCSTILPIIQSWMLQSWIRRKVSWFIHWAPIWNPSLGARWNSLLELLLIVSIDLLELLVGSEVWVSSWWAILSYFFIIFVESFTEPLQLLCILHRLSAWQKASSFSNAMANSHKLQTGYPYQQNSCCDRDTVAGIFFVMQQVHQSPQVTWPAALQKYRIAASPSWCLAVFLFLFSCISCLGLGPYHI